jgi:hypothetical protein
MPLVPMPARFKSSEHTWDQWHSSQETTFLPGYTVKPVETLKVLIDTVILSGVSDVVDADNNIVQELHGSELPGPPVYGARVFKTDSLCSEECYWNARLLMGLTPTCV